MKDVTFVKNHFLLAFILICYTVLRLPLLFPMNEYYDYDEGTYLLIARLINSGYLPYRDIFAVHPPLYYYALALWQRLIGDGYIEGRLLSLVMGLLSVVLVYRIGEQLRGKSLGLLLALFLTLDPLLVHVNSLVFHESSIEFFTLGSLYYFVRYTKEKNRKFAYISLFLAGLGSTSKFTILPYALALYVLIFFLEDDTVFQYIHRAFSVLLNKKQVFIIAFAYILMTLIVMASIILWPSWYVRKVIVIPIISKIMYWNHIIPVMVLLLLWGTLTLSVFKVSYVGAVKEMLVYTLHKIKYALILAFMFFAPKFIVEGLLGVLISRDYLTQTYLIQGSRSFPIINFFMFTSNLFKNLEENKPEFLIFVLPFILGIVFVFAFWTFSRNVSLSGSTKMVAILLLVSSVMYFAVSPSIISSRFILPLTILMYIVLGDLFFVLTNSLKRERVHMVGFLLILFMLIADFGVVYQYPHGNLEFIYAVNTKQMRNDMIVYSEKENLSLGKVYSLNPMNTYYLKSETVPYYIDSFGIFLLEGVEAETLFRRLTENNVNGFVISTWAYYRWLNKNFRETLRSFIFLVKENSILLFGESYSNRDVLELYLLEPSHTQRALSVGTYKGMIVGWTNRTKLFDIYAVSGNTSFNFRTVMEYRISTGDYMVTQDSRSSENSTTFILRNTPNSIIFSDLKSDMIVNFTCEAVVLKGDRILKTNESTRNKKLTVFCGDYKLEISGQNMVVEKTSSTELKVYGETFNITLLIKEATP